MGLSGVGMLPLFFAFLREICAAPILFCILLSTRWALKRRRVAIDRDGRDLAIAGDVDSDHVSEVGSSSSRIGERALRLLPGIFIFIDQACSLTGVTLADPVSAAAWQPSQVIFTTAISALLGMEVLTMRKGIGILLTVGGALCLVFLSSDAAGSTGPSPMIGNVFFFSNCLASSLEVIMWRKLLCHATSPIEGFGVMAESYLVAACLMALACIATSYSPAATDFFCPECHGDPWHLPPQALWSVAYSIVFQTVVGYCAQAWALCYAESSLVALYATIQPITASVFTCALLACGFNPHGVLRWPGKEMIGALLIIIGLMIVECRRNDATCFARHSSSQCEINPISQS
jgi:drug/metabolite transporter (DMT)-like permease